MSQKIELGNYPTGHALTNIYTPLHVSHLVLMLLKETFANVPDDLTPPYPWKYKDNYNDTEILIDTVYNKDSQTHGKPLLVVNRGQISAAPIVLGDRVFYNYPGKKTNPGDPQTSFHKFQTTQLQSSLSIKIISKHSGEVDILSNTILEFLVATRTLLTEVTPIQFGQNVQLTPISKFEQDDSMFYCQADLAYTLQYKWTTFIHTNLIKSISIFLGTEVTDSEPPHERDRVAYRIAHYEENPEPE
jgi:hypothetical protein